MRITRTAITAAALTTISVAALFEQPANAKPIAFAGAATLMHERDRLNATSGLRSA